MDCPNLDSRNPYDPVCRLRQSIYVPSTDELAKLCTTDWHYQCPLYLRNLRQLESKQEAQGHVRSLAMC